MTRSLSAPASKKAVPIEMANQPLRDAEPLKNLRIQITLATSKSEAIRKRCLWTRPQIFLSQCRIVCRISLILFVAHRSWGMSQ